MLSWMSWLPPFQAATTRAPAMWSGALGSPLSRPANAGTCEVSVPITPTRSSAGGPAGAGRVVAGRRTLERARCRCRSRPPVVPRAARRPGRRGRRPTIGEWLSREHCTLGERGMDLTTPLTYVKGIGPARAGMLASKGLTTVEDLLAYVPFRYEDRSNMKPIAQLAPGEMATVIAEVRAVKMSGFKRRSLGMFEPRFTDASRAILVGKWFHGGYLANVLAEGVKVALFGKVEFDTYAGELTMLHPEFEILSGDDDEGMK